MSVHFDLTDKSVPSSCTYQSGPLFLHYSLKKRNWKLEQNLLFFFSNRSLSVRQDSRKQKKKTRLRDSKFDRIPFKPSAAPTLPTAKGVHGCFFFYPKEKEEAAGASASWMAAENDDPVHIRYSTETSHGHMRSKYEARRAEWKETVPSRLLKQRSQACRQRLPTGGARRGYHREALAIPRPTMGGGD